MPDDERLAKERGLTTLGGNDTSFPESVVHQLEVWLLEKTLSWTIWVTAVGDDNIKGVLVVVQELETVANVDLDLWVLEANRHSREILLGETDDGLVNVAKNGLLDALVLDNLTEDTTITTANDKNLLWVWVRVHGEVGDHLLVGELVALGALDDVVKDEDHAVVGRLEDENILVLRLFVVNNLVDLEGHSLTRPHVGDFTEPAI